MTTGARWSAVAAGAVVFGAGLYVLWLWQAPPAAVADGGAPAADPAASTQPAPSASAAPEAVAATPATPAPAEPAATAVAPPAFDVVRVEPDGAALVAGRAGVAAGVEVQVDGASVTTVASDRQGRFVALFSLPASDVPRRLTLLMTLADGRKIPSTESVLLAPTAAPAAPAEVVAAAPEGTPAPPAADPAPSDTAAAETAVADATADAGAEAMGLAEAAAATTAAAPETAAAEATATETAAPEATAPETAVAAARTDAEPETAAPAQDQATEAATAAAPPAALLLSDSGVRVLRAPSDGAPSPPGLLAIDAISYSDSGEVQLSGRGLAGQFVRLYVNNRPVLTSSIDADGTWSGTLPDIDKGVYTLRADQVDAAGAVTARFETPFQREDPALVAATTPAPGAPVTARASVTVQPGYTLWQIAEANYGEGMLFVRVFEANRALIRDPDLIYPGQIFTVPALR